MRARARHYNACSFAFTWLLENVKTILFPTGRKITFLSSSRDGRKIVYVLHEPRAIPD